ncbi:DUF7620 family protein [Microbacterium sp. KNMS]
MRTPVPTVEQVEQRLEQSDVGEARELRQEATDEMRVLKAQSSTVAVLADKLIERRKMNRFGEELTVSWTPRRLHG